MNPSPQQTDRRVQGLQDLGRLAFWENGLLPVVTQDARSGEVLMVAFANRQALERTLETGEMHYWSRSRQELWHKGATSGNYQTLISLHADCDEDTLLARVIPRGPACHTGDITCFGELRDPARETGSKEDGNSGREDGGSSRVSTAAPARPPRETLRPDYTLPGLWSVLKDREKERPEGSYTARLLEDDNLRLKKLGEESAELILALSREDEDRAASEAADLLYHILVALLGAGVELQDLLRELDRRRR